jgi:hypothetical protein
MFVLAVGWFSVGRSYAQSALNLGNIVADTQRMSESPSRLGLVWWTPEEFWRLSAQQGGGLTEDALEEIVSVLRPYLIFAVIDGEIGPFGAPEFVDEKTIRDSLKLIDTNGVEYQPLPEADIPADLKNFFGILQLSLRNMMGSMGENLHLYCFPAKSPDGEVIAAARHPGTLSVRLGEELYEWRLPLGSFVPPKICPVDGEKLNGAWEYCPWHGKKLAEQRPSPPEGEGL